MIKITFKNLSDIQTYYQKQLDNGNAAAFKNIKTKNGKNVEIITDDILQAEAYRLKDCIQRRIEEYYFFYESKYYQRTYGLQNALKVEAYVFNENGNKYIGLYFDEDNSWGKSVITGKWNGYKPYLINDGFKDKSYSKPHFLGFKGFNFIEKGINDWKSSLKYDSIIVKRINSKGNYNEM